MNKRVFLLFGAIALLLGCQSEQFKDSPMVDISGGFEVELESILPDIGPETKTYADENHLVLWHNDDRISVFEKREYPEEYRYTGRTGTVGGRLLPVSDEGSVTGGDLDYYYAVYPHSEYNGFDNDGHLLLTIPKEQPYDEFSFGRGTNVMVSSSEDNSFRFKNIGGYLVFKLYGEGVSVSSIRLTGNNGELLTGDIDVVVSPGVDPVVTMSDGRYAEQYDEAILVCDPPVALGATADDYKEFWFVLPPVTLNGYSIEVTTSDGRVWTKTTDKVKTITRNHYSPVSAIEVVIEQSQPNNVIYYTSTDGNIVTLGTPYYFDASIVSNEYVDGRGIITFDKELKSVGINAFGGCASLASIILPESVESIGVAAFQSCTGLTDVRLPDGLKSIGDVAFSACTNLRTIYIPENVEEFGGGILRKCTSLESFTGGFASQDGRFLVDSGVIIAAALHTFDGIIPEGITGIGRSVFEDCTDLTDIMFPESLRSIEGGAFYGCTGLTSIVLPDGLTSIGDSAFKGCSGLTEVGFPESLTYLGSNAFADCKSLTRIELPNGLKRINSSAFYNCTSVTSVSLPESLETIGDYAFEFLSNLTEIDFPGSLKRLGKGAFAACKGLTSIDFPEGMIQIGSSVFFDCIGLTTVSFPDGITSIGRSAFSGCVGLTSVTLPQSLKSLDEYVFSGCKGLTSITFPEGLEAIGGSAFSDCSGLTSLSLPSSLTTIGLGAIRGCTGLVSVSIPAGVTSIGPLVFSDCTGLESVVFHSVEPPAGGGIMFDYDSVYPIFVPAGSVESYKSAEYWSFYADRIQAIAE